MGTDLPYAAEAEMTLSPDELEVGPIFFGLGKANV